ncbi:hypothetical protein AAHA92_05073 [Salvia divinorum]|uniref:KNOX1 domain-containing protein n=1 Tax=Salvia divinorum TaxID=28513 RepID=A0ABD1I3C9_SALDI
MESGGSSSNSCFMAFGENSNGYCPIIMSDPDAGNTLFLPIPCTNHRGAGVSSMMFEDHTKNIITSTGCYFMDDAKARIMAHPHNHRLLSAYANCQKIGAPAEVVAKIEEACA